MKVLVTGSNGFVGKNLLVRLAELDIEFDTFTRSADLTSLAEKVQSCDFIVHLAGVNRPQNDIEFKKGNTDLTVNLCNLLTEQKLRTPIIYSSSIQADFDNPYGVSKKLAEKALDDLSRENGNTVLTYRLPNVFGKWCKPNYNSAVATFCYNTINNLPIKVNDPSSIINLVYIDDIVNEFVSVISSFQTSKPKTSAQISPIYQISVGDLVEQLKHFKDSKLNGIVERVGTNLTRALYSTYISYYKPENFTYPLVKHEDPRGVFVEMLKTKDSGQFSFFTAHPGITRGGHYHHSKNEKFLVIKGQAKFCFRHIDTDEYYELETNGVTPEVVETVPGWSHDITNVGDDELIVMLWANEIFDREAPDTINYKI